MNFSERNRTNTDYHLANEPLVSPRTRNNGSESLSQSYVSIPNSEIEDFSDFISKPKVQEDYGVWRYFQTCFCVLMAVLIVICIYTVSLAKSGQLPSLEQRKRMMLSLNNGTHDFEPTVILVSLDGFRADYLERGISPNLKKIIDNGTRAKFMIPSFPSITFPNHYTLVTGLYPDNHGIVGNTFYDPNFNRTFNYRTLQSNLESEWWGGEPIWLTNQKSKKRSAVHMWPGSEHKHDNVKISYLEPFNKNFQLEDKANQLLGWIDLPQEHRPTFLGAYIFDVDTAGHDHGPNSDATNQAIQRVDKVFGKLLEGLDERNLTNLVNIVIVSDHGMAEVLPNNLIYLDDFIDMDLIATRHVYPFAGLTPKKEEDLEKIYLQLKNASQSSSLWDVYKRSEIPERFHYGNNIRVPPIFCLQSSGWAFVTKKSYTHLDLDEDNTRGLHGYDNLHPDMRAIFIGQGPFFKPGLSIDPFYNVELYGLIAKILDLKPAPNNGTVEFLGQFSK